MISYLNGTVRRLSRNPAGVVIVAGGIGHDVVLPDFVLQALLQEGVNEGDNLELEIYYHVTERSPKPLLVGFKRLHEKRFFEQLIEVEGLGPARAAAALVFSVSTVARAIENEDLRVLTRMPGIGNRGAQKMVATLKGRVMDTALLQDEGFTTAAAADKVADARSEAIDVLVSLGYRAPEARSKVEEALARRPDIADDAEELMREIFRAQAAQTESRSESASGSGSL